MKLLPQWGKWKHSPPHIITFVVVFVVFFFFVRTFKIYSQVYNTVLLTLVPNWLLDTENLFILNWKFMLFDQHSPLSLPLAPTNHCSALWFCEFNFPSSFLKDNFTEHRILSWWCFFLALNSLNSWLHSLLSCVASEEKKLDVVHSSSPWGGGPSLLTEMLLPRNACGTHLGLYCLQPSPHRHFTLWGQSCGWIGPCGSYDFRTHFTAAKMIRELWGTRFIMHWSWSLQGISRATPEEVVGRGQKSTHLGFCIY